LYVFRKLHTILTSKSSTVLTLSLKTISDKKETFKVVLKRYLNSHFYFTVDEFLQLKEFLCHRYDTQDEILSMYLAQENREMYSYTHSGKLSRNEMPGSVRHGTLVSFVKRRRRTLTVDRQLTDWRELVTS
jgi:hypothetical protein